MLALYRLVSGWPLALLHGIGAVLGWLVWLGSPTYRRRFAEHAALAGYSFAQVRPAVAQAGRMAAETPRLWFGPPVPVRWDGVELLEDAFAAGRGILFMTPHMGSFEVVPRAVAERYGGVHGPITVLYRPARHPAMAPVIETARRRASLETAPTNLVGVRQLLKALRAGRAVGVLPDQVPPEGMGQWVPFFGRPAYTMTLAARLALQTGATPLLGWGERLPGGQGYIVHLRALAEPLAADLDQAVVQINRELERLIRECPQQYLWGYGRYKTPRGAP